jgi:catechol 2,3-dioxygenase-like lactoylglutathione lyase family enzyme
MIDSIATVCLFVSDQDRAKDFYLNKLGMELRMDAPLAPNSTARWLSVAPKDALTELVLYLPDENWEHYKQVVGKSQAVTFKVSNLETFCADLKRKGVTILQEPKTEFWGTYAMIQDSEGNSLLLSQSQA